jgi:NTE family protein
MGIENFRQAHVMHQHLESLLRRLPAELRDDPAARFLRRHACRAEMDVVNLIYRPAVPQGANKDFEFSRATMQVRWEQGRVDAAASAAAAPWRAPYDGAEGIRSFDVLRRQACR